MVGRRALAWNSRQRELDREGRVSLDRIWPPQRDIRCRRAGLRSDLHHAEHPTWPELPDRRYRPKAQISWPKRPPRSETDRFAFHGQAHLPDQYCPPFRAPYSGPNSLIPNIAPPRPRTRLFVRQSRLWQGAEAWINPEIDQGFGLSGSVARRDSRAARRYKVGADYPYTRLHSCVFFARRSISAAKPRRSTPGSTSFPDRRLRTGWCFTVGKVRRRRHLRHQQIRP